MPVDPNYKKKVLDELADPSNVPVAQPQAVKPVVELPIPKIPSTPIPSAAIPNKKQELLDTVDAAKGEAASKSDADIEAQNKKDLAADMPKPLEKDLAWLEQQYEVLNAEYKNKQKDAEWRAVAETISNSLTKLFAARAGMKAGVNMSGLQLDRTDFNKELEGVREDIARRRGQAENLFGQQEKQDATELAQADKEKAAAFERERFEYQKSRDEEDRKLQREDMARKKAIHELDLAARKEEKALKAEAAKKGVPLTATEIEGISGFSGAVTILKNLEEAKSLYNIDTGKISNIRNYLAQQVGIDDEKVTVFKKDLAEVLANKVKALSGAAASDKEREFLKFTLPSFDQNDEQFLATLDNAIKNMGLAKLERLKVYEQAGKDVSGFKQDMQELEKQQSAAKPTPAPHGNKVKQNGTTFVWDGSKYIPEVK